MSAQKKLNELAERKQLLVLQGDLHRAILHAEVVNARARLLWAAELREKLPGGPLWVAGGAVAGFFALRQWRTAVKWLPAGLAAWRWFKKFKAG